MWQDDRQGRAQPCPVIPSAWAKLTPHAVTPRMATGSRAPGGEGVPRKLLFRPYICRTLVEL